MIVCKAFQLFKIPNESGFMLDVIKKKTTSTFAKNEVDSNTSIFALPIPTSNSSSVTFGAISRKVVTWWSGISKVVKVIDVCRQICFPCLQLEFISIKEILSTWIIYSHELFMQTAIFGIEQLSYFNSNDSLFRVITKVHST